MKKLAVAILALSIVGTAMPSVSQAQEAEQPKVSRSTQKKIREAVNLYVEGKDTDGAVAALTELSKGNPTNFDIHTWLGYLQLTSGQTEAAIKSLRIAHDAEPADLVTMVNLASAYQQAKMWNEAADAYSALQGKVPDSAANKAAGGYCLLMAGKNKEAVPVLMQAVEMSGDDTELKKSALLNLGMAQSRAGDNDGASRSYAMLAEIDPGSAQAQSWLGFNHLQAGHYEEAAKALSAAHEANPNDLEVMNNLATAYVRMSPPNNAKALDIYKAMAAKDNSLFEPWYNMGVIQLGMNDAKSAEISNREALKRKPGEPFAMNNLGRSLEMQGRNDAAAEQYKAAADARRDVAVFQRNAGIALVKAHKDADAVPYLDRALKTENDREVRQVLADVFARQGKVEEALKLLEGTGMQVTGGADSWYNLGVMRAKNGDKEGAIEAYKKSLELDNQDLDATNNLGLLLLETGKTKDAIVQFERLVGMAPASMDAKVNLAAAYALDGQTQEAVELWKTVVASNPGRADIRLDLANGLWMLGKYDEAYGHFTKVLASNPNNPEALNGKGLMLLRQSDNKGAEASFRKAIAARKDFIPAYNNLAVSLERLNRRKEAIQVLKSAQAIDPNNEDVKKNLDRMSAG